MQSGLGRGEGEPVVQVGETGIVPDAGALTAVLAVGSLPVGAFRQILGRCDIAGIEIQAAGYTAEAAIVVVGRRDGPETLQIVESTCES